MLVAGEGLEEDLRTCEGVGVGSPVVAKTGRESGRVNGGGDPAVSPVRAFGIVRARGRAPTRASAGPFSMSRSFSRNIVIFLFLLLPSFLYILSPSAEKKIKVCLGLVQSHLR